MGLGIPHALAGSEPLFADGLVGQVAGVTGIVAADAGQRPAVQAAACDLGLVKTAFRIQYNGFGTALAAALDAVGLAVVEDVPLPTQLDKAAVGVAIGGLGRGVAVPSDVCIGNEDSAIPVAGQRLVGDSIAQVVALLRGIHKVIPFADFPGRRGFVKAVALKAGASGSLTAGQHLKRPGLDGVHVRFQLKAQTVLAQLECPREIRCGAEADVEIDPAIVVHQHARVEHLGGGHGAIRESYIAQIGEGPLGRVADSDLTGIIFSTIIIQIVPSIRALHAVGGGKVAALFQ